MVNNVYQDRINYYFPELLYHFKNLPYIKTYIHDCISHHKRGPVIHLVLLLNMVSVFHRPNFIEIQYLNLTVNWSHEGQGFQTGTATAMGMATAPQL